jgi:hypothetical protein
MGSMAHFRSKSKTSCITTFFLSLNNIEKQSLLPKQTQYVDILFINVI